MSVTMALVITAGLLLTNAFFVGAEFAIMSVRRAQLEPLAEQGVRGAKTAIYAVEHVSLMLACAQLGITICSTGLGVVAEPALAGLVEGPLVALGMPAQASHVIGFILALAIVIFLHVVLGEMVPKNLAVAGPERAALWFGPPLVWAARITRPIISALDSVANMILRLGGVKTRKEVSSTFTAEEVASIVKRSQAEGILEDEVGLLSGALEFSSARVGDVMVPLSHVQSLPSGVSVAELEAAVARTGFSRFPIHDDTGAIIGYVHIKDTLYTATAEERDEPIPSWRIRPLTTTEASADIEEALTLMQHTGAHLALVTRASPRTGLSDSGDSTGTAGVVFLEDILEELVGEVRDSMQRRGR